MGKTWVALVFRASCRICNYDVVWSVPEAGIQSAVAGGGELARLRWRLSEPVEIVNLWLTFPAGLAILFKLFVRLSAGQEGFRSLTSDTMCQNLFETIRVFER